MTSPAPSPLGSEPAALIARRVSIIVGTRDAALRPHVMRAAGCRLSDDRRRLLLLMPALRGAEVLADLRANRQVAVVFSEPTTHRTLQVKGHDAVVGDATEEELGLAAPYHVRLADELAQLGFGASVTASLLGRDEPLAAIRFTIAEAFEQTPGPAAGERLAPTRG
ncbi:MAG: hypothetical protein ABT20_16530 [Rubrivivax sp. SCN 70-15]|nr:MAG: hypothetical protein ABT20_16530 [Rubrivivax sp. SCN 70-15]